MDKLLQVERLIDYAFACGFIGELDTEETRNVLWRYLGIEGDLDSIPTQRESIEDIYAFIERLTPGHLIFEYEKESWSAGLLACVLPRNGEINRLFWEKYSVSPSHATQWFYKLSMDSIYIRMDRVSKNVSWTVDSDYGMLDITINMTKPEKSPKEIELQKNAIPSVYPKCLLCLENVGYGGNVNHPARQQHKVIKLSLDQEDWYLQYSPYVYYNEHAIVFAREHRPMKIDRHTFKRLLDFVDLFPSYFIGSNADLHTVGGSILSHDHYQAGCYTMPMMRANSLFEHRPLEFPNSTVEVLKWPLSVLKICSTDANEVLALSDRVFSAWVSYSDPGYDLMAYTHERHNTVTPIAHKQDDKYVMHLALRNNRRTPEHPDGLFHPHAQHHHIKRENIGLIEVMGLAVLPSRLKEEMDAAVWEIESNGTYVRGMFGAHPQLEKHSVWLDGLSESLKRAASSKTSLEDLLKQEMGRKFEQAITNSGIFSDDIEGFKRFIYEGCAL